jgi:hypothetical protein
LGKDESGGFGPELPYSYERKSSRNRRGISSKEINVKNKSILFAASLSVFLLMPSLASAQGQTSSGTLTVTATIQSSISLTFVTDVNGVALTGSGTNVATLNFGNVSQFTSPPLKVTETVAATSFTVSTPFDVSVVKSNVTSANYTLTAEVQTPDPVNTWMIDTFPLTIVPAAPTSLTVTGVYGANVMHTLYLTIPFSAGASVISNSINFVATAN